MSEIDVNTEEISVALVRSGSMSSDFASKWCDHVDDELFSVVREVTWAYREVRWGGREPDWHETSAVELFFRLITDPLGTIRVVITDLVWSITVFPVHLVLVLAVIPALLGCMSRSATRVRRAGGS